MIMNMIMRTQLISNWEKFNEKLKKYQDSIHYF